MSARMLALFWVVCFSYGIAATLEDEVEVIEGASYVLPLKNDPNASEWPLQYLMFYAADGTELEKVGYDARDIDSYAALLKKRDLKAPKPQPISYKICYRSFTSAFHVSSHCFIDFYDKHENRIKRYSYNCDDRTFGSLVEDGFIKTLDMLDDIDTSKIKSSLFRDMNDEYSDLNREFLDYGACTIL